ncbi:MAG: class I SAM-dependent methyltransferase [Syntrophales bacterium]|jgi:ubiquinone/menaquinone biosynthesis C-methylase UbiE
MMENHQTYWNKFLGIDLFKVKYYAKLLLYKYAGIKLPKLKSQKDYWKDRGQVYMDEIIASGYLDREVYFQDMLVDKLRQLDFESFFEAGCGFGWNIKRIRQAFPSVRVSGLDFSVTQLLNSNHYLKDLKIPVVNGDNCIMPFKDNSFDVGFSLGVFMNIHPSKIRLALQEMIRVCRKYVIHMEYDENNTTPELREKRAFKTNIVSHDYKNLYDNLGMRIVSFLTFKDFGDDYRAHAGNIKSNLNRWEGFEGPEKYIFILVEVIK